MPSYTQDGKDLFKLVAPTGKYLEASVHAVLEALSSCVLFKDIENMGAFQGNAI